MSRETTRLLIAGAVAIVLLAVALVVQALTQNAIAAVAGAVAVALVALLATGGPPIGRRRR